MKVLHTLNSFIYNQMNGGNEITTKRDEYGEQLQSNKQCTDAQLVLLHDEYKLEYEKKIAYEREECDPLNECPLNEYQKELSALQIKFDIQVKKGEELEIFKNEREEVMVEIEKSRKRENKMKIFMDTEVCLCMYIYM